MYSVGDVTVLIPVYISAERQLEWLKECLVSVRSQGSSIIVVDDYSPIHIDEDIISVGHYYRLTENKGVSAARNIAAGLTNTPLIFPLDADDTLKRGAIQELVDIYNGTPVYPDLSMFGDKDVAHYQLLDFSCDLLYKKVGLASVNVLHEVSQWEAAGKWREDIHFYEDGEYNARLMLRYCGRRYPRPLVNYRIHTDQRTYRNKYRSAQQVRKVLSIIKEHRGMSNTCCGKRARRNSAISRGLVTSTLRKGARTMDATELPGTQNGRVLAQYTGSKGAGKHYYRGLVTKFPYNVKYGELYYVDPADAREEEDTISSSLLIVVHKKVAPVEAKKEPKREPREVPKKKEPVVVEEEELEPLPNISNLRWRQEIRHMKFSPEIASELYAIEENGKGRVKVLAHLKKYMK